MFETLPKNHFKVIYADPAWRFETFSEKGKEKSPEKHYDCMSLDEIKAMPVAELAADRSALLMWVTFPLLKEGIETMEAWGWDYKSVAFTWAKKARRDPNKWHFSTGYYTRANAEICILGTRNKRAPERLSKGVPQLIVSPVREHSRKPDEAYDRIEALFPGPYLELFARTERPGWTAWGNQTERFSHKEPNHAGA